MKITLTIDTTEPFSTFPNLKDLVDMAIEELELRQKWNQHFNESTEIIAKSRYTDALLNKSIANINLMVVR
jgi:hypothetical protein